MTFVIPLIGAISNSFFRGGFIKHWLPRFRGGKIINAAIFGLCGYYTSHNGWYAFLMGLALILGQAPALFHDDTDKYKAAKDWLNWAAVVAERGAIWALPLGLVTFCFYPAVAPFWAVLAIAMPICYSLDWTSHWWKWAMAEALFGACYFGLLLL